MKDTQNPRPTLHFDYDRFAPLLDDPALSEDQKRQVLEALWTIIVSFVELGFQVDPAEESCGQLGRSGLSPDLADALMVKSGNIQPTTDEAPALAQSFTKGGAP